MAVAAGLGLVLSVITAVVLRPTTALPAAIAFTIISSFVIGVELRHHRLSRNALMVSILVVLAAQAVGASIGDDPTVLLGSLAGGLVAGLAVSGARARHRSDLRRADRAPQPATGGSRSAATAARHVVRSRARRRRVDLALLG